MWKLLRSLSISPKAWIFWWRVLHNIILEGANLKVHHVTSNGSCQLCYNKEDTTGHALFWCHGTKKCWKDTVYHPLLKKVCNMDIRDIFVWMEKELSRGDFEQFVMRTPSCMARKNANNPLIGTTTQWN